MSVSSRTTPFYTTLIAEQAGTTAGRVIFIIEASITLKTNQAVTRIFHEYLTNIITTQEHSKDL